jgi:antitoxin ChpS
MYLGDGMAFSVTLRQSGGSIILTIPKAIAKTMALEAGSVVHLAIEHGKLSVTPARRGLAERLAASPKVPSAWGHEEASLRDGPVGRELL